MNKKEYYPIFDQKIAGLLMFQKYRLITSRPDKYDKTKNIFFFEKSEQLIEESSKLRCNKREIEQFMMNLK